MHNESGRYAHLGNIHGVSGDDVSVSHFLVGVHDPCVGLLIVHLGGAIVFPPILR